MLSGILQSDRAVDVNIAIIRTFVQMRTWLASHRELERKLDTLEKKYHKSFQAVFDAIKKLMVEERKPKRPIGFQAPKPE